jgi:hypothetical protein
VEQNCNTVEKRSTCQLQNVSFFSNGKEKELGGNKVTSQKPNQRKYI